MKTSLRILLAALLLPAAANPLTAAEVKKKDGQLVQGKIEGYIIEKGYVKNPDRAA